MVEARPSIDTIIKETFDFDELPVDATLAVVFPGWEVTHLAERDGEWFATKKVGSSETRLNIDKRFPGRNRVAVSTKNNSQRQHVTIWNPAIVESYVDKDNPQKNRLVIKKDDAPHNRVELHSDGTMFVAIKTEDLQFVGFDTEQVVEHPANT